jgi:hypothetical protein
VQIVHKQGGLVVGIDHIGSAHDEIQLAVLMEAARRPPSRPRSAAS